MGDRLTVIFKLLFHSGCPGSPSVLEIVVSFLIIVFVVWFFLFSIGWVLHRKRTSLLKLAITTFAVTIALFILGLVWLIWSAKGMYGGGVCP